MCTEENLKYIIIYNNVKIFYSSSPCSQLHSSSPETAALFSSHIPFQAILHADKRIIDI